MPVLNLDDYFKEKKETFEVRYYGKKYVFPLAQDLELSDFDTLINLQASPSSVKDMKDFLAKYMGEEVVNTLTVGAMTVIFNGWAAASNGKKGDLTTGES